MKNQTLIDCIEQAERFAQCARKLLKADDINKPPFLINEINCISNPKESGAVRRASMDLTRRLADLRQGRD